MSYGGKCIHDEQHKKIAPVAIGLPNGTYTITCGKGSVVFRVGKS